MALSGAKVVERYAVTEDVQSKVPETVDRDQAYARWR